MTVLIASGTTDAASADFTVAAGTPLTIYMNPGSAPLAPLCQVSVELKAASSTYILVGRLTYDAPAVQVDAAGTYRVRRSAVSQAFAVESV